MTIEYEIQHRERNSTNWKAVSMSMRVKKHRPGMLFRATANRHGSVQSCSLFEVKWSFGRRFPLSPDRLHVAMLATHWKTASLFK